MEKVTIQELNKLFKVDEKELFNLLMKLGNKYGRKILYNEYNKVFVDPYIYEGALEELSRLNDHCVTNFKEFDNKLIPFQNGSYIYYLINECKIVYVGQTINIGGRISCHLKDKKFTDVFYFEVPNKDRLLIESYNIIEHNPFYNGQGVDSSILLKGVIDKVLEKM